jgi:hypothetical protein
MKDSPMPKKSLVTATLVALAMNVSAADPQLTVYSGDFDAVASSPPGPGMSGFALVRETRAFDLAKGDNRLSVTGLPAAIDAGGVRFTAADAKVRVTGQRFNFALADQSELLRRSLGETVVVTQALGSERQTYRGRLLAAGDGLTLALESGGIVVLSDYASFELASLPGDLFARPTLAWEVESPRAGSTRFTLDYPTGGLAWRAEYLANLSGQGKDCRMQFSGAAQVLNRSGAAFDAARLTLVAGEPNREPVARPQEMMMVKSARMDMAAGAPPSQPSGEYHAYRLPGTIDLPDGSVQRVPLLADADAVACTRRYETRAPIGYYRAATPIVQPDYGPNGMQPVLAMLEFANRKDAGLGVALPAGRLRVFERGGDEGEEAFLGEASIDHTAVGREIRAALGEAFDLSAERTREDFSLAADRREMTETIGVTLRNAKPGAATVRVIETLPRWSDWEIVESSLPWTRVDAQSIAFEVPVAAAGEATLRYTVRYRWPDTVRF